MAAVNDAHEPEDPTANTDGTPEASPAPGDERAEGQVPPGVFAPPPGADVPPEQLPPPGYSWAGWPEPGVFAPGWAPAEKEHGGVTGVLRNATAAWMVAGVLALTVGGLSVALASVSTTPVGISAPVGGLAPSAGRPLGDDGAGFSRGALGTLGVVGTVSGVGQGRFTVTDRAGQAVTVDEQSSTIYDDGVTSARSSAVVTGARVAVQGTRTGNTVTATRVTILPAGGFGVGSLS